MKDYWVHTNYGSPNYRTIVRPLATMAELDRGINARDTVERVNGQEAGQKLNQQVGSMLDTAETTVLRLVSEISYAPSPH